MNLEDIRDLIRQGEGGQLEFKEEPTLARGLAKAFVAFANHQGGIVLVGVTDRGQIAGVQDWPALESKIRDAALNNCRPAAQIQVERVETPEGTVAVVRVPEGVEKPYRAANVYYVRDGLRSRVATPPELTRILYQSGRFAYDRAPMPGARFEHLDATKVERYVLHQRRSPRMRGNDRPPPVFLGAVGLLDEESQTPTVAALLLFGVYPQRFLLQAAVNAVRFRGREVDNQQIMDSVLIEGTVDEQIEESVQFVLRHSKTAARIEGVYREDLPEYPEAAIREVITNAIAHRDYMDNRRIALRMFDDRLEVINPGALLGNLTIDALLAGAQPHRRNLLLFSAARNLGLVEEQAGGIHLIIREMKESGSPDPVFASHLRTNTFSVTLPSRWWVIEGGEEEYE
jgi:ATP-dependent DNA helicase RecG